MSLLIPLLIVAHVVPAVFWVGSTAVLARMGPAGTSLQLRGPQTGASAVAIVFGLILWFLMHSGEPGKAEYVLGAGGLCALLAFAVQQGVAWRSLRAGRSNGAGRFAAAQRLSAVLLVLALISMVIFRYV
jgi:hypothetical protein